MSDSRPILDDGSNTIYYLEISTPHLHDITITGPFHPLEAILPYIEKHSNEDCMEGFIIFERNYVLDNPGRVIPFDQITSPINQDPKKTKIIRLIKEHNPEMASKMSGQAYVVLCSEPHLGVARAPSPAQPTPPMKGIKVHGAFGSKTAAEAHARIVAADMVKQSPGLSMRDHLNSSSGSEGLYLADGTAGKVYLVHVVCM